MNRRSAGTVLAACAVALSVAATASAQTFPPYPGKQPTKDAASATVNAGGDIIWTITIFNDAADDPAQVTLSDDVPDPADGLPVANWGLGDILTLPPGATPTYNGDRLSVTTINVDGRSSTTLVFRTRVNASAADGTQICNQAFLRYTVTICTGPLCSDENFQSATRPTGAVAAAPTCVTVINAGPPGLDSDLVRTSEADSCPQDPGFPAPDNVFSPGETVSLTLAIRNIGTTDLAASPKPITGTLQPGTGFTIASGTSPYSTTGRNDVLLANGGNTGTNDDPFVIRISPEATCPSTITLRLTVSNIAGGPYTVNFPLQVGMATGQGCAPKCLAAPLSAGSATLDDQCGSSPPGNNGAIDPGETIELTLPVANAGPDDLGGTPTIDATLSSLTAGVTVVAGRDASSYPDLPAGTTRSNATLFAIQVAESVACGTPISLRLELANTEAGTRTVDYAFAVAQPCSVCSASSCAATAQAQALGSARYCLGGTVRLDAQGSGVTDCAGVAVYRWLENGVPIPGATAASYDVPTTQPAGTWQFAVEVSCSTDSGCFSTSSPVQVIIDPLPLVVSDLLAVRRGIDAVFSWGVEATATGGYNLYSADDKTKIPLSRAGGPPGVSLVDSTTPDPSDNTLTHVGAITALPALLHYQVLAVCSDGLTEGPN